MIVGVVLVISPKNMLNYFVKKDLKNFKDTNENISIIKTRKICKVGGVYCIAINLLDKFIQNSEIAVIFGYFIIPIIGLYLLEKKLR